MEKIVSTLNDIVWNPALVVLLLVVGLYFSVRTRLVQVRRFGLMLRSLFGKKASSANGISSFEAFCIALSGRVGTGNIVGVATAIAFGGPGVLRRIYRVCGVHPGADIQVPAQERFPRRPVLFH